MVEAASPAPAADGATAQQVTPLDLSRNGTVFLDLEWSPLEDPGYEGDTEDED